jgi:hypothetical protein
MAENKKINAFVDSILVDFPIINCLSQIQASVARYGDEVNCFRCRPSLPATCVYYSSSIPSIQLANANPIGSTSRQ